MAGLQDLQAARTLHHVRYLNGNLPSRPWAWPSFFQSTGIIINDCILVFNHADTFSQKVEMMYKPRLIRVKSNI